MRAILSSLVLSTFFVALFSSELSASIAKPSLSHSAKGNDSGMFIDSGFFSGGERSINSAKLVDIRRATNKKFERVVFEMSSSAADQAGSVPYFIVNLDQLKKKVVVSVWANVNYDFDKDKVAKAFIKSSEIGKLHVVPVVEEGLATFEFSLKGTDTKKIKAFYLTKKPRIVIDFQL